MNRPIRAPLTEERLIALLRTSGDVEALHDAAMEGMARLLERSPRPRKLTEADRPTQHQHCLIWLQGADHWAHATMNFQDAGKREWYFLLANSGIVRRALHEVEWWMPMPPGPA